MKLHLPATWYRARAIIVRRWGWSPIEMAVLLFLRDEPGTSVSVSQTLGIGHQIVEAAISRLMRFGLVEVRFGENPALHMTEAAREHLKAGRPLPERSSQREMFISLVFDRLGGSVFRRRNVKIVKTRSLPRESLFVNFVEGEPDETDESMEQRVRTMLSGSLRPGESFAGVRQVHSIIEPRYVQIDLEEAKEGRFPEGSSENLEKFVSDFVSTGTLPKIEGRKSSGLDVGDTIDLEVSPDHLIAGGAQHLTKFEEVVGSARSDIFILSTFVASQDDPKAEMGQNAVWSALENACRRGVRVHLFLGTALDKSNKHAKAMNALFLRLRQTGGKVAAYTETVRSHAKLIIADDGLDGGQAVIGSCNWLQSPFQAHEMSLAATDDKFVVNCLELLRSISSSLPNARGSRDAMQSMQTALANSRPQLVEKDTEVKRVAAKVRFLLGPDHLPLLRTAAHSAKHRFVCLSHKLGAPMYSNLFDPAQVAGQRIEDVRAHYSLPTGPVKKRHAKKAVTDLEETVKVIQSPRKSPMLHAKVLLWDNDDAVISSFNWGSQSASEERPLDELGIHIYGEGVAELVHS